MIDSMKLLGDTRCPRFATPIMVTQAGFFSCNLSLSITLLWYPPSSPIEHYTESDIFVVFSNFGIFFPFVTFASNHGGRLHSFLCLSFHVTHASSVLRDGGCRALLPRARRRRSGRLNPRCSGLPGKKKKEESFFRVNLMRERGRGEENSRNKRREKFLRTGGDFLFPTGLRK